MNYQNQLRLIWTVKLIKVTMILIRRINSTMTRFILLGTENKLEALKAGAEQLILCTNGTQFMSQLGLPLSLVFRLFVYFFYVFRLFVYFFYCCCFYKILLVFLLFSLLVLSLLNLLLLLLLEEFPLLVAYPMGQLRGSPLHGSFSPNLPGGKTLQPEWMVYWRLKLLPGNCS